MYQVYLVELHQDGNHVVTRAVECSDDKLDETLRAVGEHASGSEVVQYRLIG